MRLILRRAFSLPFSTPNGTDAAGRGSLVIAYRDESAGTWVNVPCSIAELSSSIAIYMDASTLSATDQFYISGTYIAA